MTNTPRRSPAALDALRVRALQGDRLADCADSEREWIWRSLLLGIRRELVQSLAGLDDTGWDRAVLRVKRFYQQRIDAYKARPRIVRPLQRPPRRRWFWEHKGAKQ